MVKFRNLSKEVIRSLGQFTLIDALFAAMIIGALSFYDLNLMNIMFQMGFIALTLWEVIRRKEPLFKNTERNLYIIWYGAFTSWALLSRLWAKNLATFNSVFIAVVQVAAIGIAMVYYLNDKKRIQVLVRVLAAASLAFCIRFFVSVPVSIWGEELRNNKAVSFFSNRGPMAMSYISLVIAYLFINKYKYKWALLVIALLSVFVSLMFGTRKVLIFFGVGIVVLLAMKMKTRRQALLLLGGVIIAGALAWVLMMKVDLLYSGIGYRIEKFIQMLTTGKGDGSAKTRKDLAEIAVNLFRSSPLLGVGLDGFRYQSGERFTYSHNNYLEIFAGLGFVGFALYYWFPVWMTVKSFVNRHLHPSAHLVFAFMIALFVSDAFQVSYTSEHVHLFLAILASLLINKGSHYDPAGEKAVAPHVA